jgi:hypothetical protein
MLNTRSRRAIGGERRRVSEPTVVRIHVRHRTRGRANLASGS